MTLLDTLKFYGNLLRDIRSLIIFNFNKRLLELTHLPFPIFFLGLMLDSIPSLTGRFDGSLKEPPPESSAAAARFRLHCRNRAPRPPGADPTAGIERHGKLERAPHGGSWADLQRPIPSPQNLSASFVNCMCVCRWTSRRARACVCVRINGPRGG